MGVDTCVQGRTQIWKGRRAREGWESSAPSVRWGKPRQKQAASLEGDGTHGQRFKGLALSATSPSPGVPGLIKGRQGSCLLLPTAQSRAQGTFLGTGPNSRMELGPPSPPRTEERPLQLVGGGGSGGRAPASVCKCVGVGWGGVVTCKDTVKCPSGPTLPSTFHLAWDLRFENHPVWVSVPLGLCVCRCLSLCVCVCAPPRVFMCLCLSCPPPQPWGVGRVEAKRKKKSQDPQFKVKSMLPGTLPHRLPFPTAS